VTVDPRDARIAELEAKLAERDAQIAGLLARIAELEELVRKSSNNSSKPPSSDGPGKKLFRRPKPSGKKPGGQPGHKGWKRELVPAEEVDRHHDCVPAECSQCAAPLQGCDPAPLIHQVFHLPEIKPFVEQYALHELGCTGCGAITRARLPAGVPTRSFGPSVVAAIAVLMGAFRMSKRAVQALLADLFGLSISLGAIVGSQKVASKALAAPVAEAQQYVADAAAKHADETSWRDGTGRVWLWAAVTPLVTVFLIQATRSADAAKALLGQAKGVLISDRYSAYHWWPLWDRQVCWSHLIRDFTAIAERGGESKRIGDGLLAESKQLFLWWNRVRDGTLSRESFRKYVSPLRKRVDLLLDEGAATAHSKKTSRTCVKIQRVACALWYFVDEEGIEPTNNTAERAVRHGVLWRKSSLGTKSIAGSDFVSRVLTAQATLRQQGRNVLAFVRAACEAQLHGTTPPSLLPPSDAR
jgi:transposase